MREWSGEEERGMAGEGLGGFMYEEEGGWSGVRGSEARGNPTEKGEGWRAEEERG